MASYDDTATVRGSIAYFSDGADEVPCKSVKVTLPASLDGYNSASVVNSGLQIADFENNLNSSSYGCTIEKLSGGGIRFHGTTTQTYLNLTSLFDCEIKSGVSITLSRATARPYRVYVYLKFEDNTTANVIINQNASSVTYTTTKKVIQIRLDASGLTASTEYDETIFVVLQYGSSASSYVPYIAPTTYSANLGRTVHGAEVDFANGTGKDTTLRYELDENDSWSAYSGASHSFWHNVATGEDRPIKQTEASASICNFATYSSASPASAPDFSFLIQGGQRIVVTADSTIDTVDKFKTWLSSHNLVFVCPASTPTDFAFTGQEIPTRLGYNAFWSEQGDSEVTYYKDGYGFTSVTVHKETPDGEPVVQTAKFHRIVYGGTADVVKGTCEPKNLLPNKIYTVGANTAWLGDDTQTKYFSLKAGTYTVSVDATDIMTIHLFENGESIDRKYNTKTATFVIDHDGSFAFELYKSTGLPTVSTWQLELGSSASDYVPHFEPFTFPPISMETDEGENTLFANEGESSITYRKAVD